MKILFHAIFLVLLSNACAAAPFSISDFINSIRNSNLVGGHFELENRMATTEFEKNEAFSNRTARVTVTTPETILLNNPIYGGVKLSFDRASVNDSEISVTLADGTQFEITDESYKKLNSEINLLVQKKRMQQATLTLPAFLAIKLAQTNLNGAMITKVRYEIEPSPQGYQLGTPTALYLITSKGQHLRVGFDVLGNDVEVVLDTVTLEGKTIGRGNSFSYSDAAELRKLILEKALLLKKFYLPNEENFTRAPRQLPVAASSISEHMHAWTVALLSKIRPIPKVDNSTRIVAVDYIPAWEVGAFLKNGRPSWSIASHLEKSTLSTVKCSRVHIR